MKNSLWTYGALLSLAIAAIAQPAAAQYGTGHTPGEPLTDPNIPDVGIEQQLGARVPMDLPFKNEDGNDVVLGDYFNQGRPVVLALVYYECPMLCGEVLNGMLAGFKDLDYTISQEYDVLAISFNPKEDAELASAKKKIFVENYGRDSAATNWHFLTGPATSSQALAKAVGFGYQYLPDADQYAHGSAIMVLTPDGELSKYLFGVTYAPDDLRQSLLAAGEGKIGSLAEQVVYRCFLYNSATGQYSLRIMYLVRMAGVATLAALASVILIYLWRDRRKRKKMVEHGGRAATSH